MTTFRHEVNGSNTANLRSIEATDPLGGTEHLEFFYETPTLPIAPGASEVPSGFGGLNNRLNRYNSFYWSKRAWALGKGDLSKATVSRWIVGAERPGWQKYSYVPHSIKQPLEGRVWFTYPGQSARERERNPGRWRRAAIGKSLRHSGRRSVTAVCIRL